MPKKCTDCPLSSHAKELAMLGIAAFLIMTAVSFSVNDVTLGEARYLSVLGQGSGGAYFNLGIILFSILAIPFFASFADSAKIQKLMALMGVSSVIFLIIASFFPMSGSEQMPIPMEEYGPHEHFIFLASLSFAVMLLLLLISPKVLKKKITKPYYWLYSLLLFVYMISYALFLRDAVGEWLLIIFIGLWIIIAIRNTQDGRPFN